LSSCSDPLPQCPDEKIQLERLGFWYKEMMTDRFENHKGKLVHITEEEKYSQG